MLLNDAVATFGGNLSIKATNGAIVAAANGTVAADGAGNVSLESHTDTTIATVTTGSGNLTAITGGAFTMPEGGIFTVGGATTIAGGTDAERRGRQQHRQHDAPRRRRPVDSMRPL
ncbi:MAG: hypothetical protein QM796_10385 [Chthoniobacteraceae bacterium]